jgi:hypothetical protein
LTLALPIPFWIAYSAKADLRAPSFKTNLRNQGEMNINELRKGEENEEDDPYFYLFGGCFAGGDILCGLPP